MVDVERHWPWVVLGAAVVANVLSGGVVRSYGIIYMDFRDRLETSSVETGAIAALALGIAGLIAPLAQGLTRKLNCFLVSLFGSIDMCLGFLISSFLPGVLWHYITLGLLVGLGCGLVHVASILAVMDVFSERRVLVTALLSASFPLGTFLFGFIVRGLLDTFSYFGTFLILSAIVANCIVCSLLFRPYKTKKKSLKYKESTYQRMTSPVDELERESEDGIASDTEINREVREVDEPVEDETSRIHTNGSIQYQSVVGPTEELVISASSNVIRFSDYVVDDEVYVSSEDEDVTKPGDVRVTEEPRVEETPPIETSEPEQPAPVPTEEKKETPSTFLQGISDPGVVCSWRFLIVLWAVLLYSTGFGIPLVYYPDLSREHDISDMRAVWTLTVIGVVSAFCVVVSEFSLEHLIPEYPRTLLVLIAGSTLVGGIIVAFAHYYSTFELLLLSAILFGLFSAPCRSLGVGYQILRETTVTEDLTPFFIWANFVSGAGFIIGIPVSGVIYDIEENYSWPFGFAGICLVLSAVLCTMLACHARAHVRLVD